MAIIHMFDVDGAFIAGDTETELTAYAYPSSHYAALAKRNSGRLARDKVAARMVKDQLRYGSAHEAEYDARHWAKLNTVRFAKVEG